jgi:hypothetical protein
MELTYENIVYPIKLEADYYNHYYVGNVIDSYFFKYYLINVLKLNIDIDMDTFDYIVALIDQNVNILTLSWHQSLILEKNSYKIIDNNEDLEEEEKEDTIDEEEDLEETEYVTLENTNY